LEASLFRLLVVVECRSAGLQRTPLSAKLRKAVEKRSQRLLQRSGWLNVIGPGELTVQQGE